MLQDIQLAVESLCLEKLNKFNSKADRMAYTAL